MLLLEQADCASPLHVSPDIWVFGSGVCTEEFSSIGVSVPKQSIFGEDEVVKLKHPPRPSSSSANSSSE